MSMEKLLHFNTDFEKRYQKFAPKFFAFKNFEIFSEGRFQEWVLGSLSFLGSFTYDVHDLGGSDIL